MRKCASLLTLGAAAVLTVLALLAAPARAQTDALEYSVKASFLYRFASFVTWPPDAFASPMAPLRLCVMGADPFGETLDRTVAGRQVEGRGIEVRRLAAGADPTSCHILYLRAGEQGTVQGIRAAAGSPVLTVTDADATPNTRGMVHFVLVDDRVRFHIDDAHAAESGLTISSRLLNLAVSVRRRA